MNTLTTLLKSTRVSWSSKTVNMFLLALTYAYFSSHPITNPLEILGGMVLVCALWGALYSLNDLTDLKSDRKNPEKQDRAFIKNNLERRYILAFVACLIGAIFIISLLTLDVEFTVIMALMVVNQLIYTLPPVRLKDNVLAPLASTANNSVLRIAACCVLLGNILLVPVSVYLFMYTAGLGTYLMYKGMARLSGLVGVLSGVILIYVMYFGEMNLVQLSVAILPAIVAGIPLYLSLYLDKEKMSRLADVLYHQVALVFFMVCMVYILFF